MSNLMLWTGLAVAEVAAVLLLVLTVSWFRNRRQRKRDRMAVQKFIDKVERTSGEREAEIRGFIQDNFGLSDDELEQKAVPIIRGERRLYQSFVNLYLQRDPDSVSGFHLTMHSAVEPYWQLEGFPPDFETETASPVEPQALTNPIDSEELIRLRIENQQLSDELQITMNTITRMLNEYSSMFSGGSVEVDKPDSEMTDAAEQAETKAEDTPQAALATDRSDEVEPDVATANDEQIFDLDDSLASVVAEPDFTPESIDEVDTRQEMDAAEQPDADDEVDGIDTDEEVSERTNQKAQQIPVAGVSDAAVDELLADVLGDADLGLDDLFDEVTTEQPGAEVVSAEFSSDDDRDAKDKLAS